MNRTTRASLLLSWAPLLAVATGLCACSDATGSLVGGDLAQPVRAPGTIDASGGGEGGGALQSFQHDWSRARRIRATTTPGRTCMAATSRPRAWPVARSAGMCHGGPGELGTSISGGYMCGSDPTACWNSMTSSGSRVRGERSDLDDALYGAAHEADGEETLMPLASDLGGLPDQATWRVLLRGSRRERRTT